MNATQASPGNPPATQAAPGHQVTSPVLVGRAAELAWMQAALARVRQHAPATLLIGGAAGTGKSRLVTEIASRAAPTTPSPRSASSPGSPPPPSTAASPDDPVSPGSPAPLSAAVSPGAPVSAGGPPPSSAASSPGGSLPSSAAVSAGGPPPSSAAASPGLTVETACVLRGECVELGAVGLPFAPFTAILRDLVGRLGTVGLATLMPGDAGRALARLLPECIAPVPPGLAGDDSDSPGRARVQLFEQVHALLRRLAESGPVVLVIEDAQWADESSRALLSFLVGHQQALDGVLIIVTYRSDELHRSHPLRPLLARLSRLGWVQRAELAGLSRDESGELIGRILGRQPDPSLIDSVYRRTDGNPLFVEELLCCDGQRGKRGKKVPGSSPPPVVTLRDTLLTAVWQLPEETQDVLRAASVSGQRTGRALLAAVTGLDAGTLAAALRPAVERGVLTASQDGCAFRHALIGETLHQDLLPADHSALHYRFAVALQADPSLVPAGRAAIEQAEHWYHAHDLAHALRSAWLAAAEARRALACGEQLAMLTRVLELWRSVPDAEQLTGTGHARVLQQSAAIADALGEHQLGAALAAAARDEIRAREPARPGEPGP